MKSEASSSTLHLRNSSHGYDFDVLIGRHSTLSQYVLPNAYGDASIDFANRLAVKALNQAMLKHYYGVVVWDIPKNYLCPPIPGKTVEMAQGQKKSLFVAWTFQSALSKKRI